MVGVVARASPSGVFAVYVFGPARESIPTLDDVGGLSASAADFVGRINRRGLWTGRWPLIGTSAGWRREDWPLPAFSFDDPRGGGGRLVRFADRDPATVVDEQAASRVERAGHPAGAVWEAGDFEERLVTVTSRR